MTLEELYGDVVLAAEVFVAAVDADAPEGERLSAFSVLRAAVDEARDTRRIGEAREAAAAARRRLDSEAIAQHEANLAAAARRRATERTAA